VNAVIKLAKQATDLVAGIPLRPLLCLLALCTPVLAQTARKPPQRKLTPTIEHNGWLKANDYLQMEPDMQRLYIMGVFDGWYMAPLFGAPENGKWLMSVETCAEGMKGSQIAAIVDKYIRNHPEKWDFDLKDLAYQGVREACTARGQWQR
jgi:hypothetical protein